MNINCSEKCIYQCEGNCTLNHITISSGMVNSTCPYFIPKENNINKNKQKKE